MLKLNSHLIFKKYSAHISWLECHPVIPTFGWDGFESRPNRLMD
jgi:hypothetical protein